MEILLNSIALEPNRWGAGKVPHFRLEDLLEPIALSGFSAIEVWQNHAALLDSEELKRLRRRADSLGITFPVLGVYPQFHLEGIEREAELKRWNRALAIRNVLDARMIKVMPGRVASAEMTGEVWDTSVEFVREMLRRTPSSMSIAFETHAHSAADDPEALLRFFDAVGSDRLKVCWQPFDMTSTEKAIALYDRLAPHVVHVHLQGRKGDQMELLEDADIDYGRVLARIFRSGFDGFLSIEFVRDCIVQWPERLDVAEVLANARRDRQFIEGVPGFEAMS